MIFLLRFNVEGDFQHLGDLEFLSLSVMVSTELKLENKYPHLWDMEVI